MKARKQLALSLVLGLSLTQLACEEKKESPKKVESAQEEKAPEPEPVVESPPHLVITESGPSVRGSTVLLSQPNGVAVPGSQAKLAVYLGEEEKFLKDQKVRLVVDRKAKPSWVSTFLSELNKFSPSEIIIATETREAFLKELVFVPQEAVSKPEPCTLIGSITEDRGTAIWKLSGGTARKRAKGMGGPDLSMTAETIESMSKSCDSDLFFVTGANEVDWGFVYDLAASALSNQELKLKRAVITIKDATAGHPVKL